MTMIDVEIDEDLWFGRRDDGEATAKAEQSVAALVTAQLGVRPFPLAVQRLLQLSTEPDAAPAEAVEILKTDPGLVARVLTIVNSAAYGLRSPCRSIERAVPLLGISAIAQVSAAAAVVSMFTDGSDLGAELLDHARVTAALASHLAFLTGRRREDAYTAGLLHDLGRLMLLQSGASTYEALAPPGEAPDVERERAVYGFDHAVLGGHMLKAWRLPAPLPRIVAWHHQPERAYAAGGDVAAAICLLRLADLLSRELAKESADEATFAALEREPIGDYLGLEAKTLAATWKALRGVVRKARGLEEDAPVAAKESESSRACSMPALPTVAPMPPSSTFRAGPGRAAARGSFACAFCDEPTWGDACGTCGAALCPAHLPAVGHACARCDRAFSSAARARLHTPLFLGGAASLLITALVLAAVSARLDGPPATSTQSGAIVAFACAIVALGTLAVRRYLLRARFSPLHDETIVLDQPDPFRRSP
jgi:HD-like signal output (HDOD) protein